MQFRVAASLRVTLIGACAVALPASLVSAYPLDGFERTGIHRLVGYQKAQGSGGGRKLPPGALLGVDEVRLHLLEQGRDADLTAENRDAKLQASLESIFAGRDPSYALVVVDITDPSRIGWAGLREERKQYPGSVGKTLTMLGYMDALARAHPEPSRRAAILRDHVVEATDWIVADSHSVPHYVAEEGRNRYRPLAIGDRFNMAEWIDHMVSPSANAAGATVWKEAMLARSFGKAYPVPREVGEKFFTETPKSELARLSLAVTEDPLKAAGIDVEGVRQGSFWTRTGKARVPGVQSYGCPRELARLLLRMEQGRLVDPWASLEMKRFLYMTKKRYRYAYPEELRDAAVYFKSGSYYKCVPEEGFRCRKYAGNEENLMNSIAIVESPARPADGARQVRYLVALMSNVLRKNSAWDHARLAAAIEEAVQTRAAVSVKEKAAASEVADAGKSD